MARATYIVASICLVANAMGLFTPQDGMSAQESSPCVFPMGDCEFWGGQGPSVLCMWCCTDDYWPMSPCHLHQSESQYCGDNKVAVHCGTH